MLLFNVELFPAHADALAISAGQLQWQAPVLIWDLAAGEACLEAVFAEGGDLSPALLIAHCKPGHGAGAGSVPAAAQ